MNVLSIISTLKTTGLLANTTHISLSNLVHEIMNSHTVVSCDFWAILGKLSLTELVFVTFELVTCTRFYTGIIYNHVLLMYSTFLAASLSVCTCLNYNHKSQMIYSCSFCSSLFSPTCLQDKGVMQ